MEQARQARDSGNPGETVARYEAAWHAAVEAYRGKGFGTTTMTMPVGNWEDGNFRQEEVEVPAGMEVPVATAREGILAAHSMGRPREVVDWLGRLSPLAALTPGKEQRLPREAMDLLDELLARAREKGQAAAVTEYEAFLGRLQVAKEEAADERQRERTRNHLWGFGLMLLALLPVVALEARMAWRGIRRRRKLGRERWHDPVILRSARVTETDAQGQARAIATTATDLAARVVWDGMLKLWIPGALVGAVVFIRLAWIRPDSVDTVIVGCGLGWLFLSFAGFMVATALCSPAASVRRRLTVTGGEVTLETEVGLLLRQRWQERFSGESLSFHVHREEQRFEYVRMVSWLICLRTAVDGREIMVGGLPDNGEERAHDLARQLQRAVLGI